jgi:SAM-dependent methyltransferase
LVQVPRSFIRFLARYSEGLRLAVQHGVRSGALLEYAFYNEPHGTGVVGRWIDRRFLHLSGWGAARQRTQNTKAAVAEILAQRRAAGQTTMVLDVASGTGRYLRELAREHGGEDLIIACHDRDPREVMLGRQLVKAEGLPRFTFSVGDATDESSYLTSRDPDIVLAVGLFTLLNDDAAVRSVIRLAFAHLSPGGSFICSTLAKRDAWDADTFGIRPAFRPPEVLAAWVRDGGFIRVGQRFSQPQGFTVIGWKPDEA